MTAEGTCASADQSPPLATTKNIKLLHRPSSSVAGTSSVLLNPNRLIIPHTAQHPILPTMGSGFLGCEPQWMSGGANGPCIQPTTGHSQSNQGMQESGIFTPDRPTPPMPHRTYTKQRRSKTALDNRHEKTQRHKEGHELSSAVDSGHPYSLPKNPDPKEMPGHTSFTKMWMVSAASMISSKKSITSFRLQSLPRADVPTTT